MAESWAEQAGVFFFSVFSLPPIVLFIYTFMYSSLLNLVAVGSSVYSVLYFSFGHPLPWLLLGYFFYSLPFGRSLSLSLYCPTFFVLPLFLNPRKLRFVLCMDGKH